MMRYLLLLLLVVAPLCAQDTATPDAPMQATVTESQWKIRSSVMAFNDTTIYGDRLVLMSGAVNNVIVNPVVAIRWRDRWTIAANAEGISQSTFRDRAGTTTVARIKEAYTSVTLGDADLVVGRRLLRWGTGYAFSAAGLLDPPRDPSNPGDRLNMNARRDMMLANFIHGQSALTAVWSTAHWSPAASGAQDVTALRFNTLLHGCDASLIYGYDPQHGSGGAFTATRVFGQAIELHSELAWRDGTAFLFGAKATNRAGITLMGEYFTAPANDIFLSTPKLYTADRPQYAYGSLGKSRLRALPEWKQWDLTLSAVSRINDASGLVIFDSTRRFGNHVEWYLHGMLPFGSRHSEYGITSYASATSIGVRLHL